VPAVCAGMVTVIDVPEATVKDGAGTPPTVTPVAPVKFVPVMVTLAPPLVFPEPELRLVTVGAEPRLKVKWSELLVAETPPGAVTWTSMVPAGAGGEVAVIDVLELTVKEAAAMPPKVTALALVKLVPVMATLVPPAVLPLDVPRLEMVGVDTAAPVE
jgi:hypothetical protein